MGLRVPVWTSLDLTAMPPWLRTLWPSQRHAPFVLAGVNDDDCAVMQWDGHFLIVTTDYLNSSPIAMQLGIGDLGILGRLVVAANVADLLSTGASPRALLIGVTMPRGSSTNDFKSLMKGVKREADRVGIPVVGGDTKLGQAFAVLGVGVGSATDRRELLLKNRALPGDDVWVSGHLGSCSAAVIGLSRDGLSGSMRNWAIRVLTRPSLPLGKSRDLAARRVGHGGIDVSDGLGEDISRLCEASNVGVVVDAASIPVERHAVTIANACGIRPWALPFSSGGEFQFIATVGRADRELMESLGFCRIGRLAAGRRRRLRLPDGSCIRLPRAGHRDARNMSFRDEILSLAREVSNAH